jgi:hypothetical protein
MFKSPKSDTANSENPAVVAPVREVSLASLLPASLSRLFGVQVPSSSAENSGGGNSILQGKKRKFVETGAVFFLRDFLLVIVVH